MNLSQIASILKIEMPHNTIQIDSVEIDTRTLKQNALFVALKGKVFDGHNFISEAEKKGAVAIIASQPISSALPVIYVKDTLEGLTELAKGYRKLFNIPIVGLTGSCGKTTTKTLIAQIFQQSALTLATEGTLNNHIGVPLTLMRLNSAHQCAVIEMGANHPGEIAHLTQLVRPTIALITNIGPVHLEGFKTLEGVSNSKSEIFQGLEKESIAILNANEPYVQNWRKLIQQNPIIEFGLKPSAHIHAKHIQLNHKSQASFILSTPSDEAVIQLQLTGEHQVMNALAAAACAYAQNISLNQIKTGLESLEEINRRLCHFKTMQGTHVIDDSYNANPASTMAALTVLAKFTTCKRIFVFADMLELGETAKMYHEQIGHAAKKMGIERLFTYGELAQVASDAFGKNSRHFSNKDALIETLEKELDSQTTLLVKGSNGMKMWEVIKKITKQPVKIT